MGKRIKHLRGVLFTALLLIIISAPTYASIPRVMVETENYKLAKYEPVEGTYLGAYIVQDTLINGDMDKFNHMTKKKHASFFRYVGYGSPFPEEWFKKLKEVGAASHLAWEPNNGLDAVVDDAYLRDFAKKLNASGIPVFLRFASEMNGTWTRYSGDPGKYKEKWRLVHKVMKEEAPNVMMTWTVFTNPESTIMDFYPGDDYVDWVGVNIYNVVYHNNSLKQYCAQEDPLALLDYVYNTFSETKPIQISEYGATHYTITDNKEYIDFAKGKITRMYRGIVEKYPRVKSIFYFNVNNLINAPEGRKINNYAINDNIEILETYGDLISNPHYLSDIAADNEGDKSKAIHNVKSGILTLKGTTFISASAVRKYFAAEVTYQAKEQTVNVFKGDQSLEFKVTRNPSPSTAIIKNKSTYIPLREVAKALGYGITVGENGNLIKVLIK